MIARARTLSILSLAAFLGGCATTPSALSPVRIVAAPPRAMHAPQTAATIAHVVLIVQENRSFDNLFATFPGADGATRGRLHTGKTIALTKGPLVSQNIYHDYSTYLTDYDNGKMDGFDLSHINGQQLAGKYPYRYVDPAQIAPYWDLARQYVLADHMFQTQGSGSFTAHQDLIAGGTAINAIESLIDNPSASSWGCDAPPGTLTSLITVHGQYLFDRGPFPCLTYPHGTLRDLLDARHVSWKYYVPPYETRTIGVLWNAFAAIAAVRHGPQWTTNISMPETNILNDVADGTLPMLSWVIPSSHDSDHPWIERGIDNGPSWVATVVNAIGESPYWKSTAIAIVWDDWGGFYDHVPPAFIDNAGGLGFRVPMILVSPYVTPGYVSHTQYEFGSILKFVEQNFNLGSLGTTDRRATSIGGLLHLNQAPLPFSPIPAAHSREYFLRQPPDYQPVDTQ